MRSLPRMVAWMGGALVGFSATAVAVRELSGAGAAVFGILSMRTVGGLLMLLAWAAWTGRRIGPPRPLRLHLSRNLIHFGGQAGWAWGVTVLPLATVFALEFTTPAWTTLLAVLFLGERATRGRIGGLLLGFAGVLVVLRPGAEAFRTEALVVLGSAVLFAVALVIIKRMTSLIGVLAIMVWMHVIQLPLNLGAHWALSGGAAPWAGLGAADLPAVAVLCVAGLAAQVSVANAFRHGDAATAVPLDFLRIPLIAAVGAALYGERLDWFVLLGAAITAVGIAWNLRDAAKGR